MVRLTYPHLSIAEKIILAISIGLLVGLEREFSSKDVGLRTFSITALFGLICDLISAQFAVGGLVAVLFLTVFMNARMMLTNKTLEITTSIALLVTFCLGTLVSQGHIFTPVAVAVLMTMLLAWKNELVAFAHGLKLDEIRSVVVLGLLTFVIYPILPDRYIDHWSLLNPNDAWITVIALAGISFVNYVLLKAYSTKGLYYSALLGGAVNSSAAVVELSEAVKLPGGSFLPNALTVLLMTTVAMFIRNLLILGIFEPHSFSIAIAPLLGMASTAVMYVWIAGKKGDAGLQPTAPLNVSSPVSMRRVVKLGALFVLFEAAGTLGQRYLGSPGVMAVSFIGGLFSSASSTAAAAKLAAQGKISAEVAGISTILASISSAFVNLPLVFQFTKDKTLTRNFGLATFTCILAGLLLMGLKGWLQSRL